MISLLKRTAGLALSGKEGKKNNKERTKERAMPKEVNLFLVIYAAVNIFVLFLFVIMDPKAAELWTTSFQKSMAPIEDVLPSSSNQMQMGVDFQDILKGIIDLHHDIFFFLIFILVFVSRSLFCLKKNFSEKNQISKEIWTIPGVLLFLFIGGLSLHSLCLFSELPLFLKGHCDAGGAQADESFAAEARAAQPHIPEEAPAPAPEVVIPRLEHPLIADAPRMGELYRRFIVNSFGRTYTPSTLVEVLDRQMRIERSVEAALVHDGFDPNDVLNKRHQIRGIVLYPRGTPLSLGTYESYCRKIEGYGTRESLPYQRVLRGIHQYDLFLRRIRQTDHPR